MSNEHGDIESCTVQLHSWCKQWQVRQRNAGEYRYGVDENFKAKRRHCNVVVCSLMQYHINALYPGQVLTGSAFLNLALPSLATSKQHQLILLGNWHSGVTYEQWNAIMFMSCMQMYIQMHFCNVTQRNVMQCNVTQCHCNVRPGKAR